MKYFNFDKLLLTRLLLRLERLAFLGFTGFVSVGKIPRVLLRRRPAPPPFHLFHLLRQFLFKGVFHCHGAGIES